MCKRKYSEKEQIKRLLVLAVIESDKIIRDANRGEGREIENREEAESSII